MSSKRQMTMAKMMREQAVRDRRARKQEKRRARKDAAAASSSEAAPVEAITDVDESSPREPGASEQPTT
jgi:hypothetical protein